MIGGAVHELLMLGTDAPAFRRLLAAGKHPQQIVAAFDRRTFTSVSALRHGRRRLAPPATLRQQIGFMTEPVLLIASRRRPTSRQRARPVPLSRRGGYAGRARWR